MANTLIDARGQGCPKPVMMTEEALSKITEGIVEVLVDNEDSALNVAGFATQNGMFAEMIREGLDWRVKVVKGYACRTGATAVNDSKSEKKKGLLLIIGTDAMGKEEELGKILMKGFFETLRVTRELPHTMFFLNAGVKLTTLNTDIAAILKDIEKMGVEIYSCGTCLKHYGLEHELKVGRRGTTNHIVEGLKDFEKTVWI